MWVCGVVWCGVVWCGVVWCGVVWCGCGVVWCGVVCVNVCEEQGEGREEEGWEEVMSLTDGSMLYFRPFRLFVDQLKSKKIRLIVICAYASVVWKPVSGSVFKFSSFQSVSKVFQGCSRFFQGFSSFFQFFEVFQAFLKLF